MPAGRILSMLLLVCNAVTEERMPVSKEQTTARLICPPLHTSVLLQQQSVLMCYLLQPGLAAVEMCTGTSEG